MSSWLVRPPARPRPRWGGPAALAGALLAVALLAGCGSPGQLQASGGNRAFTVPPSPQALWPASDVTRPPSPVASGAAKPVPGVTAAGDDIRAVDVHRLLAQDPAVQGDERAALAGCTGCQVLEAQYRDLTRDGHEELLVGVLTAGQWDYLHVYSLREHQVLPLLTLQVIPGFTATTVGTDLVVREPTSSATETSSTYTWKVDRSAFDRTISASGPAGDVPGCPLGDPTPSVASSRTPGPAKPSFPQSGPQVSAVPSAAPDHPTAAPPQTPGGVAKPSATPPATPSGTPPATPSATSPATPSAKPSTMVSP